MQTQDRFVLAGYDYVINAIDTIDDKVLLIENTLASPATLFSSMGAASKTDPTRVRVSPLSKTSTCPLARTVRARLRKKNIPGDFWCVYSDEPPRGGREQHPPCEHDAGRDECEEVPWSGPNKRPGGSLAHITGIFGFMLAGLVVRDRICGH